MAEHFISIMYVSRVLIENCIEEEEALQRFC